jgi:hypothetical protein
LYIAGFLAGWSGPLLLPIRQGGEDEGEAGEDSKKKEESEKGLNPIRPCASSLREYHVKRSQYMSYHIISNRLALAHKTQNLDNTDNLLVITEVAL